MTSLNANPDLEKIDENPEMAVRKLLRLSDWDGQVPIDLLHLCDMHDWGPEFIDLEGVKEEGRTVQSSYGPSIQINTRNSLYKTGLSEDATEQRRQRFTLGHEIAHCFYTSHTDIDLQERLHNPNNVHSRRYLRIQETQANEFSARLLVPTEHLINLLRGKSYEKFHELAGEISNEYNVSLEVAVQRLATVADFPCIAIIFKNGIAKRTPSYSQEFRETGLFFAKKDPIPPGTMADRIFNGKSSSSVERCRYPNSTRWFPNHPNLSERFKIAEYSFNLGYEQICTFLNITEFEE